MAGSAVGQERETADGPDSGDDDHQRGWTAGERTTFIASVVVVVALVAIAVVEYINRPAEATAVIEVTVEADQAERRQDSYAVPYSVTNSGGSGAGDVTVRFEVVPAGGDATVDELTITIDVLPVRGVEEGELLLSHDPATHTISGRVESYLSP